MAFHTPLYPKFFTHTHPGHVMEVSTTTSFDKRGRGRVTNYVELCQPTDQQTDVSLKMHRRGKMKTDKSTPAIID